MKKMKMTVSNKITFKEGCDKYLDNCRQRNLREGTINHYKQSYTQFYKYFDADIVLKCISQKHNILFIHIRRKVLNRHIRIKVFVKLRITLLDKFSGRKKIRM